MRLKPRNINPGQNRVLVDPAIATVLTRIITREVERQVAIIQEEMNKILAQHTKRLEEIAVTLAGMDNNQAQTAMEVLREFRSRDAEGTAIRPHDWNTITTTNGGPIREYSGGNYARTTSRSYNDITLGEADMGDDIREFMNLIITDHSTT